MAQAFIKAITSDRLASPVAHSLMYAPTSERDISPHGGRLPAIEQFPKVVVVEEVVEVLVIVLIVVVVTIVVVAMVVGKVVGIAVVVVG